MNITIRVDASVQIGSGHVMRCLTLADRLRKRDSDVCFISKELQGNLCNYIENRGYEVLRLPESNFNTDLDAIETKALLQERKSDLLIIDHYSISDVWEDQLRNSTKRIMVIDDLANRKHNCDILLDQNYVFDYKNRYQSLVPPHCRQFLGPNYVLLRDEFYEQSASRNASEIPVSRLLVCFGGSDPTNETDKVLNAFLELDRQDISVDVVIGSSNPHKETLELKYSGNEFIHFHYQVNNMAKLMSNADLSIGAGGTTTWERCFLSLPSIVISIAENQEEICRALDNEHAIKYLGRKEDVNQGGIVQTLRHLIDNSNERTLLARVSKSLMANNLPFNELLAEELMR